MKSYKILFVCPNSIFYVGKVQCSTVERIKLAQTVIPFQIAFMFPECETIEVGVGVSKINPFHTILLSDVRTRSLPQGVQVLKLGVYKREPVDLLPMKKDGFIRALEESNVPVEPTLNTV